MNSFFRLMVEIFRGDPVEWKRILLTSLVIVSTAILLKPRASRSNYTQTPSLKKTNLDHPCLAFIAASTAIDPVGRFIDKSRNNRILVNIYQSLI